MLSSSAVIRKPSALMCRTSLYTPHLRSAPVPQRHASPSWPATETTLCNEERAFMCRKVSPTGARRGRDFMVVASTGYTPSGGDAQIKVIGVGGGGGNAVNHMINSGVQGVEFWAINTDAQVLAVNLAPNKLQIGTELTRGCGSGTFPEKGRQAALESEDALRRVVQGADLVFITAGMGGGTGTGAAPVVARISKELGILTVGVVTFPFTNEGRRRANQALEGIAELRSVADSVIVIPNNRLAEVTNRTTSLIDAFSLADDVLRLGVQGISDIINVPGLINVDFADIKAILSDSGTAMMCMGSASSATTAPEGPDRAEQAALAATSAPLIQRSIENATGIVYNITGGRDLTLAEVNRISEVVTDLADPYCNIIFGAVVDERYDGEIHVTMIATGFAPISENELLGVDDSQARQQRRAATRAAAAAMAGAQIPVTRSSDKVGTPGSDEGAQTAPSAAPTAPAPMPWSRPNRVKLDFLGRSIF